MTELDFSLVLYAYDPWHPYHAVNELEVYCELLEHLQDKIDCLEERGEGGKIALINVQAVLSSYAFEIAMKSLWSLDNPGEPICRTHDIVKIFDDLREETQKSLEELQLTRQLLKRTPKPFVSNRYSMENKNTEDDKYTKEHESRKVTLYYPPLLRGLRQLLRDTLEDMNEGASEVRLETVDLSGE